jgi:predicted GIY-YIG superfamily endonuclease
MSEGEPSQPNRLADAEIAPERKTLAEILERLPTQPGVYLMKDRRGKMLYIGKAANLRNRVRQYFQPATGDTRDFVPLLEGVVADIETVVTSNEKEALLLENTLVKRHQPRFNVKLTDDKNFLSLRLDPRSVPFGGRVSGSPARGQPPLSPAHLHRSRFAPPPSSLSAVPDQPLPGSLLCVGIARGIRRAGA